jgi:hypothetical protein
MSDVNSLEDFYIPVLNCSMLCIDKYYDDVEVQIEGQVRQAELDRKKIYENEIIQRNIRRRNGHR